MNEKLNIKKTWAEKKKNFSKSIMGIYMKIMKPKKVWAREEEN